MKIKLHHIYLMSTIILPNMLLSYLTGSYIQSISVFLWLIMPCRDKQFGNKRKYFFIRQSVIITGGALCLLSAALK